MKLATGRVISSLITAGGWLLFGARFMLDLIGYSTAPEDLNVFIGRAIAILTTVPWWGYLIFALASTMWLMWVSWPRPASGAALRSNPESFALDAPPVATVAPSASLEVSPAAPASATPAWLEALADEDDRDMANRIWQPPRQQAHVVLSAPDPFIAFEMSFMNGTVYTLHDPTIDGRIKYQHDGTWHELALELQLFQRDHSIPHGACRIVAVRQLISRAMAGDLELQFSSGESPRFTLESFGLIFTYENRHGVARTVRIASGNLPAEAVKV